MKEIKKMGKTASMVIISGLLAMMLFSSTVSPSPGVTIHYHPQAQYIKTP